MILKIHFLIWEPSESEILKDKYRNVQSFLVISLNDLKGTLSNLRTKWIWNMEGVRFVWKKNEDKYFWANTDQYNIYGFWFVGLRTVQQSISVRHFA